MTLPDVAIAWVLLCGVFVAALLLVAIYRVAHAWFMTALNAIAEDIR